MFGRHENGNLLNASGAQVDFSGMSLSRLIAFIERCQSEGITFIASEWSSPNFGILSADPRVVLITCLRDPLTRFVSNFYFDLYHGFARANSLETFVNSRQNSTMYNYYCRVFANVSDDLRVIGEAEFATARTALHAFDHVAVLETPNSVSGICRTLGWTYSPMRAHPARPAARTMVSAILKGKFRLLWRRIARPYRQPGIDFSARFREENRFDYRLYNAFRARTA